ncbi:hypothetical protein LWI29_012801 [Acer saccharum]|uniref:Uncharacterized protein n=1 Tax=Acer saccharum TaxID=4024 RepID=A0AA39TK79_ACESA|nr:hypothetical protein LWI29_012801 [Acer saccharum]
MSKVEALLKVILPPRILEFKGLKKADQQSILDDFNKHWCGVRVVWNKRDLLSCNLNLSSILLTTFKIGLREITTQIVRCQWERVECNNYTTGRVISLDLDETRNYEATGEWYLNASLFSTFQQLQWLDLSYNGIAGCVENEGCLP